MKKASVSASFLFTCSHCHYTRKMVYNRKNYTPPNTCLKMLKRKASFFKEKKCDSNSINAYSCVIITFHAFQELQ